MDISMEVAAIQAASQGSELRQPLVGALNKLNSGSLPAVTASDVGKILKVGANGWEVGEKSGYMPVPTDTMQITDNGTYDVTNYASANVHISGGGSAVLVSKTITQNGTYDPIDDNADGYSNVTVSVSGASPSGFEVYAADGNGGARTNFGFFNNNYFSCFFDDNMSNTYTINGVSATYSTIATGKYQILATTRDVVNPSRTPINALLPLDGSVFTASHGDSGSYVSVVGGWVGYPSGGEIYESAAVGVSNSVALNSAHETLLIFIGASSDSSGINTITINGDTYPIENIGNHYGAYGMYTAIVINGNTDSGITVTFPATCRSYVSVIGIDN